MLQDPGKGELALDVRNLHIQKFKIVFDTLLGTKIYYELYRANFLKLLYILLGIYICNIKDYKAFQDLKRYILWTVLVKN